MEFATLLGGDSAFPARALALSLLVSTALGCGGGQAPAAKTPVPEAKEQPRQPEEAADLSPVPVPKNLVLVGRVQRPITLAETVARWAGLPISPRQLLGEYSWIEPLVAWDAPVQVAGVVEGKSTPEPIIVGTIGLTSLDKAIAALRDQGQSVRRVAPGVYQIAGDDPSCFVASSRGQAPARLVCGENARAVERLVPFATRGLPDMPAGKADLELEFTAEPLQRMFAQQLSSLTFLSGFAIRQLSIDHAGFDRALADAVYALAGEAQVLATDIDKVRIESKLDEAASVIDFSTSIKLRSEKSWTGQLLGEAAQVSAPAPEVFWQLPEDATSASYAYTLKDERFKPIGRTLADLADGYLDKEKVSRGAREKVKALVRDFFTMTGLVVQAEGINPEQLPAEPTLQQYLADFLGWQMFVADGSSEPWLAVYRGLHNVLNDRELRKLAAKQLDLDAKLLPTSTERAMTGKGVPPGGRVFVVNVPQGLVEKLNKEKPTAPKVKLSAMQAVLAVVPVDKRTIMVMAPTLEAAAQRLASFKAGKGATLGQRQDLTALRTNKAFAAGFGSVSSFAGQISSIAHRDAGQLLAALPHKGRSPIFSSLVVERGDGVTLRLNARVPKAVIEDAAALAPQVAPKF